MPRATPIIPSLNGGEMSPWLEGRTDFEMYPKSLRLCHNFLPLIQGPLTKRPGTRFVAKNKTGTVKSRPVPFIFSDTEAFVLEFGNSYIRFFKNRAPVLDGGSPYEIASPYAEADLPFIRYAQSADVLFLACRGYAPRKLSRFGDTNWVLEQIDFVGGPFLPEDTQGTTMTPAQTGHITPLMTSDTTPSGTVSTSGSNGFRAFDRSATTGTTGAGVAHNIQYTFPSQTRVADAYWIQADETNPEDTPSTWEIQGWNGSLWVTLDSRNGETGWRAGERRYFDFRNDTAYWGYRLIWTAIGGGTNSRVNELAIHEKADTQTPFNLTASATTGINGGAGFVASDVGRSIRLYGSDGQYRTAKIITRVSSTVVTVQIDGHALPGLAPITRWQMSAWSAYDGYPSAVTFYGDRLMWGGSLLQPQTVWGSAVGDYENHTPGSTASDALNITISSGDVNIIKWMAGDEKGLLVGASRGEFIIRPSSANEALTPDNIQAVRTTDYGSADIVPARVGKAVAFVQRAGRKLREMAYVIDVDGYRAPDLAVRAEHITAPSLVDLAYQSQPSSIIWAPRADGILTGFTYERDQEALAWHRHTLGGFSDAGKTSPAVVEYAVVIPAPDASADDVWLQVRRYINGAVVRHIEFVTPVFGHLTEQADAFFVDSGLTYSGSATATITGLGHLEGETVKVLADGATHPDRTVSGGQITLDAAASKVQVGLGYRAHAITERIDAGAAEGTAQGRKKKISRVTFRIYRSGAFKYGATDDESAWEEIDTRSSDDDMDAPPALITDDQEQAWPGGWEKDGCVHVVSDDPTPLTVLAIIPQVETSG